MVEVALRLPQASRVKPTSRKFASCGVSPVQVRKWLKQYAEVVIRLTQIEDGAVLDLLGISCVSNRVCTFRNPDLMYVWLKKGGW